MYSINYDADALKALRKAPANIRSTIVAKIEALARDPYAPNNNVKALVGTAAYRLRVGDWRVIYTVDDGQLIVEVVKVGPRGSIYE